MLRSSSGLGDGHSCSCNGFAAACLLLATACLGFSQITNVTNDQSTPIPGAGHDYLHILTETVNPANGSVSLRIQVPMPKGRGLTLPFAFAYDSSGAQHLEDGGGGVLDYTVPQIQQTALQLPGSVRGTCLYTSAYVFLDAAGLDFEHGLPGAGRTEVGTPWGWE